MRGRRRAKKVHAESGLAKAKTGQCSSSFAYPQVLEDSNKEPLPRAIVCAQQERLHSSRPRLCRGSTCCLGAFEVTACKILWNSCITSFYFLKKRESDRDVVAAAASILIVSSVKVARQTMELIKSEMHHQLPDQRINALLRFQV